MGDDFFATAGAVLEGGVFGEFLFGNNDGASVGADMANGSFELFGIVEDFARAGVVFVDAAEFGVFFDCLE